MSLSCVLRLSLLPGTFLVMLNLISHLGEFSLKLFVVPSWLFQNDAKRLSGLDFAIADPFAARRLFNINGWLLYFVVIFLHAGQVGCHFRGSWEESGFNKTFDFREPPVLKVDLLVDILQGWVKWVKHVVNLVVDVLFVLLEVLFVLLLDFLKRKAVVAAIRRILFGLCRFRRVFTTRLHFLLICSIILRLINIRIIRITSLLLLFLQPQQINQPLIFLRVPFLLSLIHFALYR